MSELNDKKTIHLQVLGMKMIYLELLDISCFIFTSKFFMNIIIMFTRKVTINKVTSINISV